MSSTCATSTPSGWASVARRFVGRGIRVALEGHPRVAGARRRLCHALSGAVPRRSRALPRADAGAAGRGALAVDTAGADGAGRGGRVAADRFGGRSGPAGACARNVGRSGRIVARSLARAGGRRPAAGGGAEPARACGPAWTRRRSAKAGPIRARRSPSYCARPGSRRPAGARRSMCRRSRAVGSCAPPWPGNAPARHSRRRLPASISSRRPSRFIAPIPARRERAPPCSGTPAGTGAVAERRGIALTAQPPAPPSERSIPSIKQETGPKPVARRDVPQWHHANA